MYCLVTIQFQLVFFLFQIESIVSKLAWKLDIIDSTTYYIFMGMTFFWSFLILIDRKEG